MARGKIGITILLGVKDLKIGEVIEYEDRIVVEASINKKKEKCPYYGAVKLYVSMEKVDGDKFFIPGVEEKEFI